LTVGSDIPFPPFEQGDPPDYEGFDIDLINAIADKMGLETSIQDKPFNLLLSGGGGQIDMAIAATTITAERAKKVDFTDPYFNASQGLLVPTGSDIQSVDDLSGKIVGAQDGTTGETYANDQTDAAEGRQGDGSSGRAVRPETSIVWANGRLGIGTGSSRVPSSVVSSCVMTRPP